MMTKEILEIKQNEIKKMIERDKIEHEEDPLVKKLEPWFLLRQILLDIQ